MSATYGELFRVTVFGESHSPAIGCVVDGMPPGFPLDLGQLRSAMKRRAPNRSSASTKRAETDDFEILCGFHKGVCTGTPLAAMIRNRDQHSRDYAQLNTLMRPGHADYTGWVKYRGAGDVRGGGHFSGRITAPLVFAGAAARQVLATNGIIVGAHVAQIAGISDQPYSRFSAAELMISEENEIPVQDLETGRGMLAAVEDARKAQDSVGGWIECAAIGLPAGLGEPFFGSVESALSQMMFSIPGVKAVEFGDGLKMPVWRGSVANDTPEIIDAKVRFRTNHSGGINGGITNGMPLVLRVAIRPTASISREQATVNVEKMENAVLHLTGRHDACIVPRACEVVKEAACIVLLDLLMQAQAASTIWTNGE